MEAKLFFLAAFIVNFTIVVKTYDIIEDQFQNVFESIAKNDMKRGKTYREILNKNTARERQVFGTMKEELWAARKTNLEKKENKYKRMNVDVNRVAIKRETNKNDLAKPNHDEDEQTNMALPKIGENFQDIRKNNRTFVDKTRFLVTLMDHFFYGPKRHYILMRPPKFGKTTLIDMMASFFRGEKHLFEGTSIYERGNTEHKNGTWIEYPVIHYNFGEILDEFVASPMTQYFRFFYKKRTNSIAAKYNVPIEGTFFLLIRALRQKFNLPVVVLGDEYDRPMEYALNVLKNMTVAEHMQNIAEGFLHNIIDERDEIKWAFVVGTVKLRVDQETVGKFYDITHHREFSSILGFTHQEIETYFKPSVRKFAQNKNRTPEDIMAELIRRYDGFRFSGDDNITRVFSPVSVIESLRNENMTGNHRYSNHVLDYIIAMFIERNLTVESLENYEIPREILFDVNERTYPLQRSQMPLLVYMLFYGYLTITEYDHFADIAKLGYPNEEIRQIISLRLGEAKEREKKKPTTESSAEFVRPKSSTFRMY